jgi:hypothetical protein
VLFTAAVAPSLTPQQRREAWRAYRAEKRTKRTDTAAIPYVSDELREFFE